MMSGKDHRKAEIFGKKRGWRLSKTVFSARVLKREGVHERKEFQYAGALPYRYMDHAYFYRKNRRAIAIVAHLYHIPDDIYEVAESVGLTVEIRPDIESWWYPNEATVVIYRSANNDE
jgi:hypothetical protein